MKYNEIIINTDGGARGNPGPAAVGIVILGRKDGAEYLFEHSETIGDQTNNTAEYMAVVLALRLYGKKKLTSDTLTFVLDSELIVRQINGQYRVKEPHLQKLNIQVKTLLREIIQSGKAKTVHFTNVLRSKNKRADQLVNQVLDSRCVDNQHQQ